MPKTKKKSTAQQLLADPRYAKTVARYRAAITKAHEQAADGSLPIEALPGLQFYPPKYVR